MHPRRNTILKSAKVLSVVALAALVWVCLLAGPASTQTSTPAAPEQTSLASYIPADAVFYVERAGHTAVREAFLASNFGELATDPAINQFVHASRVRVGELIIRNMFELDDELEIAKYQEILHEMLLPFWYEPSAMFVIVRDDGPGVGFMSQAGGYFVDCQSAVDRLMAFGVPASGGIGERQSFTFEHAGVDWQGVAKGSGQWLLPEDEEDQLEVLNDKSIFMAHWEDDMLFVALDIETATRISEMLASHGTAAALSKAGNESYQTVMTKTVIDEWAFKWYADIEVMRTLATGPLPGMTEMLTMLGLDGVLGVGGTGGYVDNVFARKTYIYAPHTFGGLLQLFKPGGSYERALAMTPDTASVFLAGQLDTDVLLAMLRQAMQGGASGEIRVERRAVISGNDGSDAEIEPASAVIDGDSTGQPPELTGEAAEGMEALEQLLAASDGNCTVFFGDVAGIMAGMMGGLPAGVVLGVTDHDQAAQAVESLIALAGVDEPAAPDEYRNIPIQRLDTGGYGPFGSFAVAIMDDRIVVAISQEALKAAIDAGLDDTGGFPVAGNGRELADLTGQGSAIFAFDLAAFAEAFWPLLMEASASEYVVVNFPLVDMPSASKLARMLGYEVAVFKPDEDGLLLDSRGQVPFATKILPAYPLMGGMMWYGMMMMGGF